jgi:hypothetical protein
MLNPYAPPSSAPAAPRRAAAVVLGWTEIIAGLALGSRGCVLFASLGDGVHLYVHLAEMMAWVVVFVGLVLPGVVLLEVLHRARWLAQALPVTLVMMLFTWATFSGASTGAEAR